MTRKQALMRVCKILNTYEQTEEIAEIRVKVQEIIKELPFTAWSESTIFDTIDQWIIENDKIPSTRDLTKKGLPPVPVIKNRFKMLAREFLDTYYPKVEPLCKSERYGYRTKEDWLIDFKKQFESIKPQSASEYNKHRSQGSPTWFTIASICGLSKWNDLLRYCNLHRAEKDHQTSRKASRMDFTINRDVDIDKALSSLMSV